jgi:hypothetical protein
MTPEVRLRVQWVYFSFPFGVWLAGTVSIITLGRTVNRVPSSTISSSPTRVGSRSGAALGPLLATHLCPDGAGGGSPGEPIRLQERMSASLARQSTPQIHDLRCGLWRSICHDFPLAFITFQPSLSRIFGSHRLSVLLATLSWSLQLKACCHSYFSSVSTSLYLPYPLPLIDVLALLLFKPLFNTQPTSTLSASFLPIHANKQYNVAFSAPRSCQGPQLHRQYGL